jgi:hypothetical protein
MPRYFMLQDGIKPEEFFSRIAYSGAHDATAAWVQAGKADGGVLNASVWEKVGGDRHPQGQGDRHSPQPSTTTTDCPRLVSTWRCATKSRRRSLPLIRPIRSTRRF